MWRWIFIEKSHQGTNQVNTRLYRLCSVHLIYTTYIHTSNSCLSGNHIAQLVQHKSTSITIGLAIFVFKLLFRFCHLGKLFAKKNTYFLLLYSCLKGSSSTTTSFWVRKWIDICVTQHVCHLEYIDLLTFCNKTVNIV